MIKTVADLTEIQMKVFARHATIRVEPVLGVAPEALDAIDMVPPLGPTLLLAHHDMVALHPQARIGLPVVGVVKATWGGMGADQVNDLIGVACRDREGLDLTVTLHDAHDQHLAGGTPAALALAEAPKYRFITLNGAGKRFAQFLGIGTAGAQRPVEPFPCRRTGVLAKPLPIHRHAQGKHLDQSALDRGRQLARFPRRAHAVALAAAAAFASPISQLIARAMITFRTSFHRQTSLLLVRLG